MEHQPAEEIVRGIEASRAALNEKLEQLDTRLRRTIDPRQQIAQRPWKWLGGAVAIGFALGWRRPEPPAAQPIDESFASHPAAQHGGRRPLRSMLMSLVAVLIYEALRAYVLRQTRQLRDRRLRGQQLTTATDASWSNGAGAEALGFDSPPNENSSLRRP